MLHIACDADVASSNANALTALLTTTPILTPACAEADISMEQWRRAGTIEARQASQQLVHVTVSLARERGIGEEAATTVLRVACDRGSAAVVDAWDRQDVAVRARVEPLEKQLEEAKVRHEAARKELAEMQEKASARYEDRDQSTRQNLLGEKREAEQELASDRARLVSMEKDPPVKSAEVTVGPLAREAFRKADVVRQHRVKRLEQVRDQAKAGKATPEAVAEAEFAVADADLYSIAYGATLTGLVTMAEYVHERPNDDRNELRASVAAAEAKVKVLDEQLAALSPPPTRNPPVPQSHVDRLQTAVGEARREVDSLQQQIDNIRSRNRAGVRPVITVLGKK
jgi:hypothetical protein